MNIEKLEEELKKNNKGEQKNKPAKKHQTSNKTDDVKLLPDRTVHTTNC